MAAIVDSTCKITNTSSEIFLCMLVQKQKLPQISSKFVFTPPFLFFFHSPLHQTPAKQDPALQVLLLCGGTVLIPPNKIHCHDL